MKKRLFAVVLVIVALITGAVASVQATDIPQDAELIEIGSETVWDEWFDGGSGSKLMAKAAESSKPLHVKITESFAITGSTKAAYLSYGSSAYSIYLDLNGNTLTYKDSTVRWFGVYNANATVTICNGTLINEAAIADSHGAFCLMTRGKLILEDLTYMDQTTHEYTANSKVLRIPSVATVTMNNVNMQVNTQNNTKNGMISCSGTLNITNSTLTASETSSAVQGGMLYIDGGTTTLTGSTLNGGAAGTGGVIYATGTSTRVTMNSGTISGGSATENGGNIYLDGGAELDLIGGTISDGTAVSGGNVYAAVTGTTAGDAYQTTVNMSGGTITGGTATGTADTTGGGNVAIAGNADNATRPQFNITGGIIGGEPKTVGAAAGSAAYGGNVYMTYAGLAISGEDTVISNGKTTVYGGNVYCYRGTLDVSGGLVAGGKADSHGGNIFLGGTASKVTISGGTVTGGLTGKSGGNIYIAARNLPVNITGGNITNGTSAGDGGNICAANGILTITGGTISGGKGGGCGGNLYIQSTGSKCITTIGNCAITDGTAVLFGSDIYVSENGKLKVQSDFAGSSSIAVSSAHLPETVIGGTLSATYETCEGPFPGQLYLENADGQPALYGVEGDTKLYIASAALVGSDGAYTWYADNAAVVAAYTDTVSYIRPAAGELALNGGSYTVDLAGQDVAITGTGSVTCFDSGNDTYDTFGTATVSGVTLANTFKTTVNGNDYCMLLEDGNYSFHRLGMEVTRVSLRPSIGGVYYTGKWACDTTLAAHIDAFGVVVSTNDMPGDDFATEETLDSMWSSFGQSDFVSGSEKTGVMVSGILKDADDGANADRIALNATYGMVPIHAAAYITIDGNTYASQGVSYSLHDIISTIDRQIFDYSASAQTMREFMAYWAQNGLIGEDWDFAFSVSEDVVHLKDLYAGRTAYHGELHDHSDSGGTSDGNYPLTDWAAGMESLKMDYAAILDHRQVLHMYMDVWDDSVFVGGTEAAASITDRPADYNYFHYNMIFATPQQLEAVLNAFPEYNFRVWTEDDREGCGDQWHFDYANFTSDRFNEVITAVKENGGFFVIPHPSVTEPQYTTEDVLTYWFQDETGLEVIYGANFADTDNWNTRANYEIWTGLLKAGKRIWATSGNDDHELPSTKCLSTVYSTEGKAQAHIDQLRVGNFSAGPVGIRMCVGDTAMGGQCDFTDQRLVFCVSDFHESALIEGHTYTVKLLENEEVIGQWDIDGTEAFYYAMDVDASAQYYRVEIYDATAGKLLGLGNPIWNLD